MVNACRFCLSVHVKMITVKNTEYEAFIEGILKLEGFRYVKTEECYACYICMALLSKSYNFIRMIINAHKVLCELLETNDKLSIPMLTKIDRHKKGLDLFNLSYVHNLKNPNVIVHENERNNPNDGFKEDVSDMKGLSDIKLSHEDICNENSEHFHDDFLINQHKHDKNGDGKFNSKQERNESECYVEDIKVEYEDPLNEDRKTPDLLSFDIFKEESDSYKYTQKETILPSLNEAKKACVSREARKVQVRKMTRQETRKLQLRKEAKKVQIKKETRKVPMRKDTRKSPIKKEAKLLKGKKKQMKHTSQDDDDDDYKPEVKSSSEDSDFDLYDDTGKKNKAPKVIREYPRKCDHCSYVVAMLKEHYRHYLISHPNIKYPYSDEKLYACSHCGKLKTRGTLKYHELNHQNREVKCTLCPKIFKNKGLLYKHRTNVHPKVTYTCNYCTKIFKTRHDISRHLRIHTGEKPYKCHICEARFAHSGNRTIHIRTTHQNNKSEKS